ncbi:hypothetical protein M1494_02315 [Candidatus Parvarchaeota archaeon]|nr:hypothetical protein [Candidatus Parvarchaeota archaeon]
MEDKIKDMFRNELSKSGMANSKISALESKLSKFGITSNKLVEDITLYGRTVEEPYRKLFYEKAVDTISQYYYTDTVSYLSNKFFSLDKEKIMNTLDVFGEDYLSFYVNFIDLGYKHSKGIEFIDKLFSLDKLGESAVKSLMRKDIEQKDIKELMPKQIFSSLY